MATITTVSCGTESWTRIDSLASHTYIDVDNVGDDSVGLRIAGSDPGAGTAWNASGSKIVPGGQSWPMRLGTSDQVWARREAATANVTVAEATA